MEKVKICWSCEKRCKTDSMEFYNCITKRYKISMDCLINCPILYSLLKCKKCIFFSLNAFSSMAKCQDVCGCIYAEKREKKKIKIIKKKSSFKKIWDELQSFFFEGGESLN